MLSLKVVGNTKPLGCSRVNYICNKLEYLTYMLQLDWSVRSISNDICLSSMLAIYINI